jgi:hypothetical protein
LRDRIASGSVSEPSVNARGFDLSGLATPPTTTPQLAGPWWSAITESTSY